MSIDRRLKEEGLAYHAARLLLLIGIFGEKRRAKDTAAPASIEGRTLLAKLDFFLRYPSYLKKASVLMSRRVDESELGIDTPEELTSVESRMVRFRYGPWDHIYYPTLAYLAGKRLITIDQRGSNDVFRLTEAGGKVLAELRSDDAFGSLARRAETIRRLFHSFNGTGLKEFIYTNFPDVVSRKLGEDI